MVSSQILINTAGLIFSKCTKISHIKPNVFVFDLDCTLWPFWVDTHVTPPFKKSSDGTIIDHFGAKVKPYPEVPQVLNDLHDQGYHIAVASRTGEIDGAHQLVDLFGWTNIISHREIYPGSKVKHLTNIKKAFGVEFSDIIFFDDEYRNIRDVSQLGVLAIFVQNGVTKKVVEDALKDFSRRNE